MRGAIGAINDKLAASRKSDRLPPAGESNASRQVLPISNTTKVGDREVVRTRSLMRVSANLTMTSTEFAASVPPFNAQKLLAVAGADGVPADDQPGAEPDAEVSYVTRDLAGILPKAKIASARCRSTTSSRACATPPTGRPAARRTAIRSRACRPAAGAPLAYAADGTPDPYAGFETRIVPENITLLPKTGAQVTGGNGWNERSVTVKKGDSIATILKEIGGDAGRNRGDRCGARVRAAAPTD